MLFRSAAVNLISVFAVSLGSLGFLGFQAVTAAPASASCKISVKVTHPRDQYLVQAQIINGCGDRIRAYGDWGGETDYGTYLLQGYSVACDTSPSCQGHPDGKLFHGGWQDRRTGKKHQTF